MSWKFSWCFLWALSRSWWWAWSRSKPWCFCCGSRMATQLCLCAVCPFLWTSAVHWGSQWGTLWAVGVWCGVGNFSDNRRQPLLADKCQLPTVARIRETAVLEEEVWRESKCLKWREALCTGALQRHGGKDASGQPEAGHEHCRERHS